MKKGCIVGHPTVRIQPVFCIKVPMELSDSPAGEVFLESIQHEDVIGQEGPDRATEDWSEEVRDRVRERRGRTPPRDRRDEAGSQITSGVQPGT